MLLESHDKSQDMTGENDFQLVLCPDFTGWDITPPLGGVNIPTRIELQLVVSGHVRTSSSCHDGKVEHFQGLTGFLVVTHNIPISKRDRGGGPKSLPHSQEMAGIVLFAQ